MAAPVIRADGFVAPCIPTLAHKRPSGPDWVHEIKHDGYRLIVRHWRATGARRNVVAGYRCALNERRIPTASGLAEQWLKLAEQVEGSPTKGR
jgi:hypothetical protein